MCYTLTKLKHVLCLKLRTYISALQYPYNTQVYLKAIWIWILLFLLLCIDLRSVLMLCKCLIFFINYTCKVSLSGLKGAHMIEKCILLSLLLFLLLLV